MLAERPGGGVGSFNQRFAQPNRATAGIASSLYPADIFPFTDFEETDPETGLKDGLLTHALAATILAASVLHQHIHRIL